MCGVFFFNDTATTEIYTLSLHDALPISPAPDRTGPARTVSGPVSATDTHNCVRSRRSQVNSVAVPNLQRVRPGGAMPVRSEEHTSELQSRQYLVCRLLLEKNTQLRKVII